MKKVTGELVAERSFDEIDNEITDVIRDFVQLGQLLIEMRDGQAYRDGGFSTFEDYCKSKAGLSIQEARRVVRYSISYQTLTELGGNDFVPPQTKSQLEALLPVVNFKTEKREYTQPHPTEGEMRQVVEQVVGIKNPKRLAEQWERTVKEFDRLKAKSEREGTKPPTLSAKFIRNQLPNDVKVSPARHWDCNPLVNLNTRLRKLSEDIDQCGYIDRRKVGVLIKAEPPCLPAQVGWLFDTANGLKQQLDTLLDILEDHKNAK